ncbi:MAG: hypothetical protein JOY60_18060 [Burkholderiaceae bacterium]|nr:hypothetical protein [Burkholderiaceae bacterium]
MSVAVNSKEVIQFKSADRKAGGIRVAMVLALGLASTAAMAGRDAGQIMAQEKANKEVAEKRAEVNFAPGAGASVQKIVLPLDHGPRAVTTPALNKERLERARAAIAAGLPVSN